MLPSSPDASLDEFAVFGGSPQFLDALHVGRPNVGDRRRFIERIEQMLDNRWFSNGGPFVREFERRVSEVAGARHAIALCNATVGLEIVTRALGLSGEVIVPAFTFVATAHALQWQQITPVFCDIDPRTHLIDPARVESLITPRTTGVLGVHLWGAGCDVDALSEIARRRGLRLLFDASHAFGCTFQGRPIGSFGDAEVFSFHATKFVNSLEGGAIVTNDDELARKIRLMKNFGFESFDAVTYVGTNGKMTEAAAAMGITSIESMDDIIATNRRNHQRYARGLQGVPGIRVLPYDERERLNYQYVVLEVDPVESGLHRDQLQRVLWFERVLARRYFYPGVHRMEPYRSHFPHASLLLPQTERLCSRILSLPTGTAVDEASIDVVCALIRTAIGRAAALSQRLGHPATPLPGPPYDSTSSR